jgi:hypothetical protein
MKNENVMRRLRAARPVPAEPGNHAALFERIVAEPGDPRLVEPPHERSSRLLGRKVRPWTRARPRVLAGSTLGLAGIGAALLIALSAGGAAAPPAFAITTNGDGSLAVNLDSDAGLIGVNRKLAAMGTNEHINFQMAQGPAAVGGPVNCVPSPQGASVSGPSVTVTVGPGDTNTETIAAGNTGGGTWHVAACSRSNGADPTGLRYLG